MILLPIHRGIWEYVRKRGLEKKFQNCLGRAGCEFGVLGSTGNTGRFLASGKRGTIEIIAVNNHYQ